MKLNKLLSSEFLIKDVDAYIFKLGLVRQKFESKKYEFYRYLVILASISFVIKSAISIVIYHFKSNQLANYERMFVWIGDYTFYIPKIKYHINGVVIIVFVQTTAIQILHNKLISNRNFVNFEWMKPFEMLAGKLKPYKIGFTCCDDVKKFVKRFYNYIQFN